MKFSVCVLWILSSIVLNCATRPKEKYQDLAPIQRDSLTSKANDLIPETSPNNLIENGANPTKTIVISHYTLDNSYIRSAIENHRDYTSKHSYDYWFRNGNIDNGYFYYQASTYKVFHLGLYWQKVQMLKDVSEMRKEDGSYRYDWIFWVDGDAVFADMNKSIEDFKKEEGIENDFFVIARDPNTCLNAGVFLMRNNEEGRDFLKFLIDSFPYYKDGLPEQTAIEDILYEVLIRNGKNLSRIVPYPDYPKKCYRQNLKNTRILPQSAMNSFYAKKFDTDKRWLAGRFIAHFTGDPEKRNTALPIFVQCIKDSKGNMEELKKCEDR